MYSRKLKFKLAWMVMMLTGISMFSGAQITLTIEKALEIAEENNPQMQMSKLSFERTQLLLEAQRASLKSQFSMSVDPFAYSQTRSFDARLSEWYTNKNMSSNGTFRVVQSIPFTDGEITLVNTFGWQNNESTRQSETNKNKAFLNNLAIRLNQPLFTYNRRKMEMQRLEFNHENAGISYSLQRLRTEQSINRQFYAVYSTQNSLNIGIEELENAKQNYAIIKDKVDAELSAKEELFQAEVNLSRAESTVETRDVALKNAKDNLKQTLGMPLSEEINVLADIRVSPMVVDPVTAIQSGLASRMELRQREIDIDLEELTMITIKASNEFKGDLALSVGITGDDPSFGKIYANPTQSPRVSVSFNIPIFDWGEKKARVRAQQAAQTIAKLNYNNEKVDIELEVRQTLRSLDNLRSQISIAEKSIRNAELTYDLNQVRYREGELTGLQMNQYQTQLSDAKLSLVSAQINYKTELLNLKILTLYDFENDKPLVPIKDYLKLNK